MNKMNNRNAIKETGKNWEYFKLPTLPMKWYSVIWKWTWICCKYIFQIGSDVKESAYNAGDLGLEDPLEKALATHSSILAWRDSMDRGAWWATVHGAAKSETWVSNEHFHFQRNHEKYLKEKYRLYAKRGEKCSYAKFPSKIRESRKEDKNKSQMEKKESSYAAGRNVNWYSHSGEQYEVSLKS